MLNEQQYEKKYETNLHKILRDIRFKESMLKERQHYIGGSDVAKVLGWSKYATPIDLYFEKTTGIIEKIDNPQIEYGNDREPEIRKKFAAITGLRVEEVNSTKFHKDYPFLAANVDGLIYKSDSNNNDKNNNDKNKLESPIAILEIKTVGLNVRKNWGAPIPIPELKMAAKYQYPANESGFKEEPGTIEKTYLLQALLYAAIYELPIVYFAVGFGNDQYLCTYKFERDLALEKMVINKLVHFWTEHVQKKVPPEPKNTSDILRIWPEAKEESFIETNSDLENICYRVYKLINHKDNVDSVITTLKDKIRWYMENNKNLIGSNGKKLFDNAEKKCVGSFDKKSLKFDHPKIYDKYYTPPINEKTRVLKICKKSFV